MNIGSMILEGKGKRVYETDDPRLLAVYFKDEAMAFHGLKRGRILGKGEINNEICGHLFTLLSEQGIPNHFVRKLDERRSLIKRVEIIKVAIKVRNIVAGSLARRIGYPEGARLSSTILECTLKDEELDYPLINETHIRAMGLCTQQELDTMYAMALKINDILSAHLKDVNIELIDFKLEFGRLDGQVILADEISPDTCRFWDTRTHEPLDIDRFRRDLGNVEQGYQEVLNRLMGAG
jgi:phosphoribosylaminoimidazole-succinocarboxamide synthase